VQKTSPGFAREKAGGRHTCKEGEFEKRREKDHTGRGAHRVRVPGRKTNVHPRIKVKKIGSAGSVAVGIVAEKSSGHNREQKQKDSESCRKKRREEGGKLRRRDFQSGRKIHRPGGTRQEAEELDFPWKGGSIGRVSASEGGEGVGHWNPGGVGGGGEVRSNVQGPPHSFPGTPLASTLKEGRKVDRQTLSGKSGGSVIKLRKLKKRGGTTGESSRGPASVTRKERHCSHRGPFAKKNSPKELAALEENNLKGKGEGCPPQDEQRGRGLLGVGAKKDKESFV